jgi:hypothetical protein
MRKGDAKMIARIEGNGTGVVIVEIRAMRSTVDAGIGGTVTLELEKPISAEITGKFVGAVEGAYKLEVRGFEVEAFASRAAMKRTKSERAVRWATDPRSEAYWSS